MFSSLWLVTAPFPNWPTATASLSCTRVRTVWEMWNWTCSNLRDSTNRNESLCLVQQNQDRVLWCKHNIYIFQIYRSFLRHLLHLNSFHNNIIWRVLIKQPQVQRQLLSPWTQRLPLPRLWLRSQLINAVNKRYLGASWALNLRHRLNGVYCTELFR